MIPCSAAQPKLIIKNTIIYPKRDIKHHLDTLIANDSGRESVDSSPWVWICVCECLLKPSKLFHTFFIILSKQIAHVVSSEVYQHRFPALKIMSEMGNSANSIFFWISAGLLSLKFGIIPSQLLTLTSDVEVK